MTSRQSGRNFVAHLDASYGDSSIGKTGFVYGTAVWGLLAAKYPQTADMARIAIGATRVPVDLVKRDIG